MEAGVKEVYPGPLCVPNPPAPELDATFVGVKVSPAPGLAAKPAAGALVATPVAGAAAPMPVPARTSWLTPALPNYKSSLCKEKQPAARLNKISSAAGRLHGPLQNLVSIGKTGGNCRNDYQVCLQTAGRRANLHSPARQSPMVRCFPILGLSCCQSSCCQSLLQPHPCCHKCQC